MKDRKKTKTQSITDLEEVRKRVSELEQSEAERRQAEQDARQQALELSILFSVCQMLAQAPPDSNEIALIMARQFVDVLGLPEASVSLYDPRNDTFQYLINYYHPKDAEPDDKNWAGKVIPSSDYPDSVRVMQTLEPFVAQASDPDIDSATLAYMKENEVKTEALFPMAVKGHFIGIIGLETWIEEHHYTPQEINLAMAMANQAAVALERAQLYETARREISERVRAEKTLRESEMRYRMLFERARDAIFLIEPSTGRYLDANAAAEHLTGWSISELKELTTYDITPLGAQERLQALADAKGTLDMEEVVYTNQDGSRKIALVSVVPLNEEVAFGLAHDITKRVQAERKLHEANDQLKNQLAEIKKLESSLREQAIRDSLTGLFNRRYMEETFQQELSRALRKEEAFSIVILDLDHLKKINDTHGHMIGGDKALQILADTLKKMCRVEDTICRYGGDEFLIILYDTSAQVAYKRVLEWKEAVAKIKIESGAGEFSVSFSAEVAEFPLHGLKGEEILIRADEALYQAKALGRNQVVVFNNGEQP